MIAQGLHNEHICASALYYYDSANVTDSYLAFRETVDREHLDSKYEQHQYDSVIEIYGLYGNDHMNVRSSKYRSDETTHVTDHKQHRCQQCKSPATS